MDKKIEKTIQICINFKLLLAERRLTMKSRLGDAFEGFFTFHFSCNYNKALRKQRENDCDLRYEETDRLARGAAFICSVYLF